MNTGEEGMGRRLWPLCDCYQLSLNRCHGYHSAAAGSAINGILSVNIWSMDDYALISLFMYMMKSGENMAI